KGTSPPVQEGAGKSSHDAAIEDVAALPAPDQVDRGMNRLGVPDHKQGTRPDDSSQKKPARQLVDTAHFEFFTSGPPGRNPQGACTGEQDHHSVGMDLDAPTRKLHQNWLHPCLLSPGNARADGPSAGAGSSSGKKVRARCQLEPISTSRVGRLGATARSLSEYSPVLPHCPWV